LAMPSIRGVGFNLRTFLDEVLQRAGLVHGDVVLHLCGNVGSNPAPRLCLRYFDGLLEYADGAGFVVLRLLLNHVAQVLAPTQARLAVLPIALIGRGALGERFPGQNRFSRCRFGDGRRCDAEQDDDAQMPKRTHEMLPMQMLPMPMLLMPRASL